MTPPTIEITPEVRAIIADAKNAFIRAGRDLNDADREIYLGELRAALNGAVAEEGTIRKSISVPPLTEAALGIYDRTDRLLVQRLPHDDRELVLLSIMARAQQSLDDMGRLPASLSGHNPSPAISPSKF